MSESELDDAYDEGYEQALLDVEERLAVKSRDLLWIASDMNEPRFKAQLSEEVRKKRHARFMAEAGAVRWAARQCEELRLDDA
jgi:hypothetical protein